MSYAGEIVLELLRKSGVREWQDADARAAIIAAAIEIAEGIDMALPDYIRVTPGTAKTIRSSGGDAAITLASLANGNGTSTGARQAVTLDLGANWAQRWRIDTAFELAATPTAGNAVNLYGSFLGSTGAGNANTSGTDAAYTGYSNNIDTAAKQLVFLGAHICTTQITATVQKSNVGIFFPTGRYLNLVVDNRSGAAFHSSDSNCVITLTPLDDTVVD